MTLRFLTVLVALGCSASWAWAQEPAPASAPAAPSEPPAAAPAAATTPPPAALPSSLWHAPGDKAPDSGTPDSAWNREHGVGEKYFPFIESHGYYRLRGDLFQNLDLDTQPTYATEFVGTSPIKPPVTENPKNNAQQQGNPQNLNRGADTLAGMNMRLRWEPVIHISDAISIHAQFDILDNLVMGSTPDYSSSPVRPDVPISTFSQTQVPPDTRNSVNDSINVKRVWAQVKSGIGVLRAGRMGSSWGLGMLANDGNCSNCDYGDTVDRLLFLTRPLGIYTALAWDFAGEGLTSQHGKDFQGQAYDQDQLDDVNQWAIAVFDRPMTTEDKARRDQVLRVDHTPTLDWGMYNVFRQHALTSEYNDVQIGESWENMRLVRRNAFAWIPDLWLKLQYRPDFESYLRFEVESAAVVGDVDNVLDDETRHHNRKLRQFGLASELEYRSGGLLTGFLAGFASGDTAPGFGILDRTSIDPGNPTDPNVNNFRFDRDYNVDLILFEELIGAVTNAWYFKPQIGYNFLHQSADNELGGMLGILFAQADKPVATPSRQANLGLELDLQLFYRSITESTEGAKRGFEFTLDYGVLFPGAAWDNSARINKKLVSLTDGIDSTDVLEAGVAQVILTRLVFFY